MKKKTTAKKGGKRKRKGKNGNNVTMEEGPNGKYDKVYNEAFGFHIKLKPDDRTPASKHMTQDKRRPLCHCQQDIGASSVPSAYTQNAESNSKKQEYTRFHHQA